MTSYPQGANAALTVQWNQYDGGPTVDVTGLTVEILAVDDSVVLAPTSAGITHITTGIYSYTYQIPANQAAGSYLAVWSATYGSSPVSASEQFDITTGTASPAVGLADVMYCTREAVKDALDIAATSRTNAQIDRDIKAASRNIEGAMARKFYPLTATMKFDWPPLPYTGAYPWRLWLDDREVVSVDNLISGGVVIPVGDYLLEPVNAGPPYNHIDINLGTNSAFAGGATWQQSTLVTGVFGWDDTVRGAGALAAAIADSVTTTCTVTDSSAIGVGSILVVDTERMLVSSRSMTSIGQTLQADLDTGMNATVIEVPDGTAFADDEVLLIDGEKMLITDIADNNLIVQRKWDGTTLAPHSAGATIYAARKLTVIRGALGTTAATHSDTAPVSVQVIPGGIETLCLAETLTIYLGEESGYARTIGSGDNVRNASGQGMATLRQQTLTRYGRQARLAAI